MKSRKLLSLVWLIFVCIFIWLAYDHRKLAEQSAPEFVLPTRLYAEDVEVKIAGTDIDQPIKDFSLAYNKYVRTQNDVSHSQNIASCIGYMVAALTALVSFLLELSSNDYSHKD